MKDGFRLSWICSLLFYLPAFRITSLQSRYNYGRKSRYNWVETRDSHLDAVRKSRFFTNQHDQEKL